MLENVLSFKNMVHAYGIFLSNNIVTNFWTIFFCANWCGMIKLVELNIF